MQDSWNIFSIGATNRMPRDRRSERVALALVLIQLAVFDCCLVEASPSIATLESKTSSSTARSASESDVSDVRRLTETRGKTNPIERYLLDAIEKNSLRNPASSHAKILLDEQESFDYAARLSCAQILHKSKFEYQLFNLTSQDGYITQLVRIINPLVPTSLRKLPPVVLYGGQGISAAAFLYASLGSHVPAHWPVSGDRPDQTNEPNRSLAITLANNGYDVWLVGARGSDEQNSGRISKEAPQLTTDSKEPLDFSRLFDGLADSNGSYWAFSHDEIIKHEFKQQLELVLSTTRQQRLSLVTYSNGAFIAYAFASLEPEWTRKHLDLMISLAPAVYTNKFNLVLGLTGLLSSLAPANSPLVNKHLDAFARGAWYKVCRSKLVRYTKCKTAMNLLYGFSDQFETHIELGMLDYIGRPISVSGFRQTLQCSFSDRFQRCDYGPLGNIERYKQLSPPVYDLKRVSLARNYVLSGEKDAIADRASVQKLLSECSRATTKLIQVPGYNHLDMLAGWNVNLRVNAPVLLLLNERYLELASQQQFEHRETDSDGQPVHQAQQQKHQQPAFRKPNSESAGNDSARDIGATTLAIGADQAQTQGPEPQVVDQLEYQDRPVEVRPNNQRQQQQLSSELDDGVEFEQQQQQGQQVSSFGSDRQQGGVPATNENEGEIFGSSPTMGWSDRELGLAQSRGMARRPQGIAPTAALPASRARQANLTAVQRPSVKSAIGRNRANKFTTE